MSNKLSYADRSYKIGLLKSRVISLVQYDKNDRTLRLLSGLKYIYQMTNGLTNEIRLDLEKSTGQKGYAVYQSFSLSERPSYALFIGEYSGTAGNMKCR